MDGREFCKRVYVVGSVCVLVFVVVVVVGLEYFVILFVVGEFVVVTVVSVVFAGCTVLVLIYSPSSGTNLGSTAASLASTVSGKVAVPSCVEASGFVLWAGCAHV